MKKYFLKPLAVLLAVVMLTQVAPLHGVIKASAAAPAAQLSDVPSAPDAYGEPSRHVSEDVSLRTADSKIFNNEDGSSTAYVYPQAVHFEDKNGDWQEYDNTLVKQGDFYAPRASDFDIALPAVLGGNKAIKMKYGPQGFTLGVPGAAAEAVVPDLDELEMMALQDVLKDVDLSGAQEGDFDPDSFPVAFLNQQMSAVRNLESVIYYPDAFPGAHLEYTILPEQIKENIYVVEKQKKYVYSYTLDLQNLVAVQKDDRTIELFCAQTGDLRVKIEAPYAVDAAGEMNAQALTLKLKGDTLTVTADRKWMNAKERKFPVTLDPSYQFSVNENTMACVSVNDKLGRTGDLSFQLNVGSRKGFTGLLGNVGEKNVNRSYLRFEMPELPNDSVITNATLLLDDNATPAWAKLLYWLVDFLGADYAQDLTDLVYKFMGQETRDYTVNVRAEMVLEEWIDDFTVWKNKPKTTGVALAIGNDDPELPDRSWWMGKGPQGLHTFDITEAVKHWMKVGGNENYGVMLKAENEEIFEKNFLQFASLHYVDEWFKITTSTVNGVMNFIINGAIESALATVIPAEGASFVMSLLPNLVRIPSLPIHINRLDIEPVVSIQFISATGLEDYFSYETVDMGRAGAGYVNHFNGALTYVQPVAEMGGERMPVAASLIYNSNHDRSHGELWNMKMGVGFRMSLFEQISPINNYEPFNLAEDLKIEAIDRIGALLRGCGLTEVLYDVIIDALGAPRNYYTLIDGDGTEHCFVQHEDRQRRDEFVSEVNKKLILKRESLSLDGFRFTLEDEYGNQKIYTDSRFVDVGFSTPDELDEWKNFARRYYYLNTIKDANGNETNIFYDTTLGSANYGRIMKVVDTIGREFRFEYDGEGYLTKIIDQVGRVTQFKYTMPGEKDGKKTGYYVPVLDQITYHDGLVTKFNYADKQDKNAKARNRTQLEAVSNPDEHDFVFELGGVDTSRRTNYRVDSIQHGIKGTAKRVDNPELKDPGKPPRGDRTGNFWQRVWYWLSRAVYELVWNLLLRPSWFCIDEHGRWYFLFRQPPDPIYGDEDYKLVYTFDNDVSCTWLDYEHSRTTVRSSLGEAAGVTYVFDRAGRAVGARDNTTGEQAFICYTASDGVKNLPGFTAGTAVVRNLLGEPNGLDGVTLYTENEVVQAVAGKQFWGVASGHMLKFTSTAKLEDGATYTLSLFARQAPSSNAKLLITCGMDATPKELSGEWDRHIVTFENLDKKNLDVKIEAVGGDILVDAVQLEKNNTASPYNHLANSYFANKSTAHWALGSKTGDANTVPESMVFDKDGYLLIEGDPDKEIALEQRIELNGNAADKMLLFGATASIVSVRDEDEKARVSVEFFDDKDEPIVLGDKLKADEEERIRFFEWLKKWLKGENPPWPDEWKQIRPVKDDDDEITNVDGSHVFANFNRDIRPAFEIKGASKKWYDFLGRGETTPKLEYTEDEIGLQTAATAYVIPKNAVYAKFYISYDNQSKDKQNAMRVQETFAYIGAGGTIFDYMGGKLTQAASSAGKATYEWKGPNVIKVEIERPLSKEEAERLLHNQKVNPRKEKVEYEYDTNNNVTSMVSSKPDSVDYGIEGYHHYLVTKTTYDYETRPVNTYQRDSRFLNINLSNDESKRVDTNIGGILTGSTVTTFTSEGLKDDKRIPAPGVTPLASRQTIEYIGNYPGGRWNDFNDVAKVTDEGTGQWVAYSYLSRANNILTGANASDDSRSTYDYNGFAAPGANTALDILTSIHAYDGAAVYTNEYSYTGFGAASNTVSGLLRSIDRNGTKYSFNYDVFGQVETVEIAGKTLVKNDYFGEEAEKNDTSGKTRRFALEKRTYFNGFTFMPDYDERGRVVAERWNGNSEPSTTYIYGNSGLLSVVEDHDSKRNTQFDYDMQGRLTGLYTVRTGQGAVESTVRLGYRNEGELEDFQLWVNGSPMPRMQYEYDVFDRPDVTTFAGGNTLRYYYNAQNGRLTDTVLNGGLAVTHFEYKDNGKTPDNAAKFAGNVIGMTHTLPGGQVLDFGYVYNDGKNGNIMAVTQDGQRHAYTYDGIGQLIEDKAFVTKTVTKTIEVTEVVIDDETGEEIEVVTEKVVETQEPEVIITMYTYDNGGNLVQVTEKVDDAAAVTTKEFKYGGGAANPGWMDQLTKVNGITLTYDAIGNLFNDGASTYHWQKGSQLASIEGAVNASYTYDYTGLRSSKTIGGVTTDFIWAGGLLMAQIGSDGNTIAWSYDQGGKMLGFTLTHGSKIEQFFYLRNLQGDVVAIHNAAGEVIVRYTYDAWGNLLTCEDTSGYNIGEINPIRYRGYYWDTETGFYYCQSRYYNPQWCRWINADVFMDTMVGILGTNMYAYCSNNPVNYLDPGGYFGINTVHNEVQKHIRTKNEAAVKFFVPTEKWVVWTLSGVDSDGKPLITTGLGRIDLISYDGQIWEVKPGTNTTTGGVTKYIHMASAGIQLNKYLHGFLLKPETPTGTIREPLSLGGSAITDDNFYFRDKVNGKLYHVWYYNIAPGLIMYDWLEVDEGTKQFNLDPQDAREAAALFWLSILAILLGSKGGEKVYE